ncbi:MAG: hypothetical protein U0457_13420 [Candidatus Sericytochromatia bacterium]
MKVNINNLDSGVYAEFQKRAADGIDSKDIAAITEKASKNGLNKDESNFITAIADKKNVDKLLKNPKALTKIDLDVENSNSNAFVSSFNKLNDSEKNDFLNLMNSTREIVTNPPKDLIPKFEQKQKIDGTYVKPPMLLEPKNKIEPPKEKLKTEKQDTLSPKEKAIFESLLANGTLNKKDSDGKTMLQNLKEIYNSKKIDGPKVMKELVAMLNPSDIKENLKLSEKTEFASDHGEKDSNRSIDKKNGVFQKGVSPTGGLKEITQCTAHYTCGAASMEAFLKTEAPEQLIKMVKDLVTSGESKFGDRKITNPPKALNFHAGMSVGGTKEDRTDADIIIQSAIMNKIALTSATYNVEKDFSYSSTVDDILNKVKGNGGGSPKPIAHMLEDMTGKKFDYEHSLDFGALDVGGVVARAYGIGAPKSNEDLYKILDTHINKGEKTIIAYNTNPNDKLGLHFVTVLGKNDKGEFVFLDTDQEKEVGSKLFTMKEAEMKNKIRSVIFQK